MFSHASVTRSREARAARCGRFHALRERGHRWWGGPVLTRSSGSLSKCNRPLASLDTGTGQSDGAETMDLDTRCDLLGRRAVHEGRLAAPSASASSGAVRPVEASERAQLSHPDDPKTPRAGAFAVALCSARTIARQRLQRLGLPAEAPRSSLRRVSGRASPARGAAVRCKGASFGFAHRP